MLLSTHRLSRDSDTAGETQLTEALTSGGTTTTDSYTYATTSNRLLSLATGGVTRSFGYTAAGNTSTDDRGASDDLAFTYNADNRLSAMSKAGTANQVMAYDGTGRRVIKRNAAGTLVRHYHYGPDDRLIAISNGLTGGVVVEYAWLGDQPVAQIQTGRIYAIHGDHLGQPMKLTDSDKAVVWDRQQRPFGATTTETASISHLLRFPGQITDPEIGTHYNMARDYDPSIGRYIQSDPIGIEGGLNTYAYVEANPIKWIDPMGTGPIGGAVGGVVGGIVGGAGGGLIGPGGVPIGAFAGRWAGRALECAKRAGANT